MKFKTISLLFTLITIPSIIHTQPQEHTNPPEDESSDEDWDTGTLAPPSHSITNYLSVLDKDQFIAEFRNKETIFSDVAAVKSFFGERNEISKGHYIELLLYFVDGRHIKLQKEGNGFSASKANLLGKKSLNSTNLTVNRPYTGWRAVRISSASFNRKMDV